MKTGQVGQNGHNRSNTGSKTAIIGQIQGPGRASDGSQDGYQTGPRTGIRRVQSQLQSNYRYFMPGPYYTGPGPYYTGYDPPRPPWVHPTLALPSTYMDQPDVRMHAGARYRVDLYRVDVSGRLLTVGHYGSRTGLRLPH